MIVPILDARAARAWASRGSEFRSTIEVSATRLDASKTWVTPQGSVLSACAGDWLVSYDRSEWTVDGLAFEETYAEVTPGRWRKLEVVHAVQSDHRTDVETSEGDARAEAGDWIVTDRTGNVWPVAANEFARRYKSV